MKNNNDYIRALVTNGLSVIPVADGEKKPHRILGAKHNLLTHLPTSEEINTWIATGITSWGVAGGVVSGNLVTLDFDEKHYEGLFNFWYAKISEDQKKIVDTCYKNSTRNHGTHLRYRTETPQPTIKLARRVEYSEKTKKEEVVTTAEVRGEGAYALIPPSAGYETMQGNLLDLPLVTDEMHEEFIDILRTFNEVEDEPATEYEYKPSDTPMSDRPGDRLNTQASWNEILEPHGWVEDYKDHWRRPGKDKSEGVSATTNYDSHPMLYVFSSSATPFEANRGYSKFHAFALLNHGGDYKVAAREAEKYLQFHNKSETIIDSQELKKRTIKSLLWSVGKIMSHDFGEEEWITEFLITKQGITALSGNPGDFKTWVTIHIALCVARGTPVFGKFKTTQGSVLIIDEEDNLRQLKKRLGLLGVKDTDSIYYLSQNGIKMDDEKVRDEILEIVEEKNITLLILDSLVRIHGQDENEAKGMAKVFSSLQKIIGAGASILFTHHHRKQQGFGTNNPAQMMRGSSDILAAVDCHITLEKKKDEPDHLILKQTKSRQAEALESSEIKILKDSFDDKGKACPSGFEYIGGYDEKKKKAEDLAATIPSVLADGMKSRPELQEILSEEFGKTAIDDGIKIAEENCLIERVPKDELSRGDRRKVYYRLPGNSRPSLIENDELPVSYPYIEVGNQEVVDTREF